MEESKSEEMNIVHVNEKNENKPHDMDGEEFTEKQMRALKRMMNGGAGSKIGITKSPGKSPEEKKKARKAQKQARRRNRK